MLSANSVDIVNSVTDCRQILSVQNLFIVSTKFIFENIIFLAAGFENRNGRAVPLHCQNKGEK